MASASPAPTALDTGPESLAAGLGLTDPALDEVKEQAKPITQEASKKRPKLTHDHFFEGDNGLRRLMRTFPKINFRGKNHEFQDCRLLIKHYKNWFQEIYPSNEDFEDLVFKSRDVLMDRMAQDDLSVSDPREKLHKLRHEYKKSGLGGTATAAKQGPSGGPAKGAGSAQLPDEVKARIEANRKRALELRKHKEHATGGVAGTAGDVQRRIEENRARALELRAIRELEEMEAAALAATGGSGSTTTGDAQVTAQARISPPAFDEEEEDPFGFGFDMGEDRAPSRAAQSTSVGNLGAGATQSAASANFFDFEEEDVFGFGGGMDEDRGNLGPRAATDATQVRHTEPTSLPARESSRIALSAPDSTQASVQAASVAPCSKELSDARDISVDSHSALARARIQENRARALERKRLRELEVTGGNTGFDCKNVLRSSPGEGMASQQDALAPTEQRPALVVASSTAPMQGTGATALDEDVRTPPPTMAPAVVPALAATTAVDSQSQTQPATVFDLDDDEFSLGLSTDGQPGRGLQPELTAQKPTAPQASVAQSTILDEDEDVFGYGFGFDDM